MALTAKRVERASKPGRYSDGHGLLLQVTPAGTKSWLFRYERNGRERWLGLGPLHTVGLAQARERARAARLQLLDGIDPLEAKAAVKQAAALAAAKALTFEEAATQYFNQHEKKWSNAKSRDQFMSSLRVYALPTIGRLSVAAIDTGLVLKVIEPIWHAKTETANRVRKRIEAVLDWATVRGYRTGDNPARWKGHIGEVLPARAQLQRTQHHAALPYAEIPAFMMALRKREGVAAQALEFLILTAARSSEVLNATWAEVEPLDSATWTVPARRMKGRREHRVPLAPAVVALLRGCYTEDGNPYLFIGRDAALSGAAMPELLNRMGRNDITVHGFRSSFRDWAAERTNYPNHVVEMALAHAVGDKVEAAYRRGDLFAKRRKLMEAWATYCGQAPVAQADNVRQLRIS